MTCEPPATAQERRRDLLRGKVLRELRAEEQSEALELEVTAPVLEERDQHVERASFRGEHERSDLIEREHLRQQRLRESRVELLAGCRGHEREDHRRGRA